MKVTCSIFIMVVMGIMLGGCVGKLENCQRLKTNDPILIEYANACAVDSGMDLSFYDSPTISEYPDNWIVGYEGKKKTLGNYFHIVIDRNDCGCDIMQGQ